MTAFVLDASAVIELFVRDETNPDLRRRVLTGSGVAPELIDLESANVIRRMVWRREISAADAGEALGEIRDSPVTRIPHRPLLGRVWELRDALTAYDAAYVALTEWLLLTTSHGLAPNPRSARYTWPRNGALTRQPRR